jgi:anti-sigma regulatory factor (Ser/Thr protein kinase)
MHPEALETSYELTGGDFVGAGRASTTVKDILKGLGVNPRVVRRIAIATYEAEMNVVMYARRGTMRLSVTPQAVHVVVEDSGPGIENVELAMQAGYSTATPEMREMGFGAGMGLPNIRKNSDELEITSVVGEGTRLSIRVSQS